MPTPGTQGVPVLKANVQNLAATPVGIGQAGGRVLYALYVLNTTAATCFVQVFDQPSSVAANITLGTTIPDLQISCLTVAAAFIPIPSTTGVQFTNGIFVASTTLVNGSVGSAAGVFVYALYA